MGRNSILQDDNRAGMEWPPCSPDLSPIEHLWDQLPVCATCVTKLVTSMRRRCQAVVVVYGFFSHAGEAPVC
uniref:Tc1-like transposase DDE domain-containing protein n=1 Tax=Amphilophus citrinellus TaxID=61819 RepID=A0A3Q0RWU0_AMPCI